MAVEMLFSQKALGTSGLRAGKVSATGWSACPLGFVSRHGEETDGGLGGYGKDGLALMGVRVLRSEVVMVVVLVVGDGWEWRITG